MSQYDDEDDEREELLKALGGEVDDFAGSQLKDPDAKEGGKGVTVTIAVTPNGATVKENGAENEDEAEDGESPSGGSPTGEPHDPIAHILGMCGGGCTK